MIVACWQVNGDVQGMVIRTVLKTVTPNGVCGFESHPLRHMCIELKISIVRGARGTKFLVDVDPLCEGLGGAAQAHDKFMIRWYNTWR